MQNSKNHNHRQVPSNRRHVPGLPLVTRFMSVLFCTISVSVPASSQNRLIFDERADAADLVSIGMEQARKLTKSVLIEFGANWCADCQALARYFDEPRLSRILSEFFIQVHIDTGHFDKNIGLAAAFGIDIRKGIPAVAVLNPDASLRFATTMGEWSNTRLMTPLQVLQTLSSMVEAR